jgi:hypothetical protein
MPGFPSTLTHIVHTGTAGRPARAVRYLAAAGSAVAVTAAVVMMAGPAMASPTQAPAFWVSAAATPAGAPVGH